MTSVSLVWWTLAFASLFLGVAAWQYSDSHGEFVDELPPCVDFHPHGHEEMRFKRELVRVAQVGVNNDEFLRHTTLVVPTDFGQHFNFKYSISHGFACVEISDGHREESTCFFPLHVGDGLEFHGAHDVSLRITKIEAGSPLHHRTLFEGSQEIDSGVMYFVDRHLAEGHIEVHGSVDMSFFSGDVAFIRAGRMKESGCPTTPPPTTQPPTTQPPTTPPPTTEPPTTPPPTTEPPTTPPPTTEPPTTPPPTTEPPTTPPPTTEPPTTQPPTEPPTTQPPTEPPTTQPPTEPPTTQPPTEPPTTQPPTEPPTTQPPTTQPPTTQPPTEPPTTQPPTEPPTTQPPTTQPPTTPPPAPPTSANLTIMDTTYRIDMTDHEDNLFEYVVSYADDTQPDPTELEFVFIILPDCIPSPAILLPNPGDDEVNAYYYTDEDGNSGIRFDAVEDFDLLPLQILFDTNTSFTAPEVGVSVQMEAFTTLSGFVTIVGPGCPASEEGDRVDEPKSNAGMVSGVVLGVVAFVAIAVFVGFLAKKKIRISSTTRDGYEEI